jgi:hypothetical protein
MKTSSTKAASLPRTQHFSSPSAGYAVTSKRAILVREKSGGTISRAGYLRRSALLALMALAVFPQAAAGELRRIDISVPGTFASAPQIASDGAGNVVVVWRQVDDGDSSVGAAFRPAAGAWSDPQRLSAPAPATEAPKVSMDRLGNAVAVWQRSSGRDTVVQASVRPSGGDWSAPQDLSTPGEAAFSADVAVQAGRATAVWTVLRERRSLVQSSSRTIAGSWATAQTLSIPLGNAYAPKVAMDDQGGAVAAWQWSDGAYLVVHAAARTTSGSWSAPEALSGPGRNASRPELAMSASGVAVVGWLRSNGSWIAAQASYRRANGTWGLPTDMSARAGDAAGLDVAMNRRGDAIMSWVQGRGDDDDSLGNLWSSFRPAGSSAWGVRAEITAAWRYMRAQIALDEAGNATAVWEGSATVSATFKPFGKPWKDNYLLSTFLLPATRPAVVTHANANATAVWIRGTANDERIQAVSYDINTAPEEEEEEEEGDEEEPESFKGTERADALVGTPGNDVFYGFGGDDFIDGRGGRDIVYGGRGNDRIFGGRGADRLFGGPGRDRIAGGRGADVLVGGIGQDFLRGEGGDDAFRALDRHPDYVFGGRGLDRYRLDRWLDRAASIESRLATP